MRRPYAVLWSALWLLCLPSNRAESETASSDAAVLRGMFRSIQQAGQLNQDEQSNPAADEEQLVSKLMILRRIALYKTSHEVRQQVVLPELSYIMMDPTISEVLRRESVKTFLTIGGEKRYGLALAPLLKENQIGIEGVLRAQLTMQEPLLHPALFWAAVHPHMHPLLRQRVLANVLEQWQESECSATLDPLRLATHSAAQLKPRLFEGAPSSSSANLPPGVPTSAYQNEVEKRLWRMVEAGGATESALVTSKGQWNALLVLGCIGDPQNVAPALLRRFRAEKPKERLRALSFLRTWQLTSTILAIGDCSRRDSNTEVRYGCMEYLANFAATPVESPKNSGQEAALHQLVRSYQEGSRSNERRYLLQLIARFSQGEATLRQLLSDEKDANNRIAIKKLLNKQPASQSPRIFQTTEDSTDAPAP